MSTEFEPFMHTVKKAEFSVLEYDTTHNEQPPAVDPEQAFREECERLKQEAIQQGYTEGINNAKEEVDAKMAELKKWIELLQKPVQLIDEQVTKDMVQTMIWICTHCIGVELTVNPDKLFGLLEAIKGELPSLKGNYLFSMHPDDVSWAKNELAGKLLPELNDILVPDSNLKRGDFYLKGENKELDGRIHTRFLTLFAEYIDKDMLITPILTLE